MCSGLDAVATPGDAVIANVFLVEMAGNDLLSQLLQQRVCTLVVSTVLVVNVQVPGNNNDIT